MRNLKRALSLALAAIMVLGMMVIGAGAASTYENFTDKDEIQNKEAVSVLTTLGVINGKDNGTYDPEGTVTRGEMAKMICVILNGGKDPQLGETVQNSYTDTANHWAKAYIEYCTTKGIVAGRGDGTFDPDGTVSLAGAAKMLLVALGYNASVQGYVGLDWQIKTDVTANQKGLYDGLGSQNTSTALTRDNAAQMCYNALDVNMVVYDYVITGNAQNSITTQPQLNDTKKGTLLREMFNAVKVEGIVIGNEAADMTSKKTDDDYATKGDIIGSSLDANKTKVIVNNADDQTVYTGTQTFNVASDAGILGRSIKLYVKIENSANKAQVIGSAIVTEDNKVVTDYSDDTIKEVADDNNLDFTSDTKVAYNYAAQTSLTAADADNNTKTGVDTGIEKILIDADNDGDLDYVLVNTVQLGKVTKYSTTDKGAITVSLASGNGVYAVDNKNDVVGFEDVAKDDYVLASFIGGKLNVAKAETVTGTIEAYKNNKKGDKTTQLTVDGTDYTVSNAPTYTASDFFAANGTFVKDKTELDTEATFYLDAQGYVIASGEVVETAYNYAYVIAKGNSNVDDRVRVALSSGSTGTYVLNSTSSVEYKNVKEGSVYAYSLNSEKTKIKLTSPADASNVFTDKTVKFEKGKSTIEVNGKSFFTNNSTAFFYVNGTDVNSYIGRANAPTVDSSKKINTRIALNKSGAVAAVVFDGVTVQASVGNHLFIYDLGKTYSDYRVAKAVLNGKDVTEEIKVDNGSDPERDTLYTYNVNGDGYYELTAVTGKAYYHYGVVQHYYSDTMILTDMDGVAGKKDEFLVDSKTVVIDNDDDPTTPDVSFKGSVGEGDTVHVLIDDDTAKMVVIEKYADSNGGSSNVPKEMVTKVNSDDTIDVFNPSNASTNAIFNAVADALEKDGYTDITKGAGNGTTPGTVAFNVTAKLNGRTNSFVVYNAARLDVNGTTAVAYLHAGDVNVTSKNANVAMIATSATNGYKATQSTLKSGANTDTNKKGVYAFNASDANSYGVITLEDAATVTFSDVDVALASDSAKTITSTNLVAVGTKLTVTATTAGTGKAIEATANGVVTVGKSTETNTKATMDYTMTKDAVTFAVITPDTAVTVTVAGSPAVNYDTATKVYTANNTTDKFDVAVTGTPMTNGTIKVAVTPKAGVSEQVVLTLTGTDASASPATTTWTAGQNDKREFTVTLNTSATATLTLSDATVAPAPTHLLTLPADVSASWSAGSGYASGNIAAGASGQAPEGATITLTGSAVVATSYLKVGTDYVKAGSATFAMPNSDLTITGDKYHKILDVTVDATGSNVGTNLASVVVDAPDDLDGTFVKEGTTVTVTFTLSGSGTVATNAIKIVFDSLTGAVSTKYATAEELLAVGNTQATDISAKADTVTINSVSSADVTLAYTLSTT